MKRMKMRAMLALCAAMSVAGWAQAGVMDKVPADAMVVIKASNLAETSAKFGKLSEKLGLTMFMPQLADPLATLKQEMKITAGLQDDGEMAIVLLDPKGGNPDQSTIFLVPTTDYKTLVSNLEGATTEGDLTVLAKDGKTVYISDWGGYAAGSQNKELITAAPSKVLEVTDRAAKELKDQDLVMYANINALREPLMAELNKGKEEAKTKVPEELKDEGNIEEKYHPAILAAVDQGFGSAEAFLRDADAATVGITFSEAGIRQSVVAEFKAGSYLAGVADSFESTEGSLLKNLPAASYLFYMGFNNSAGSISKLIDDVAGPIVAKLPADDEKAKLVPAYIADAKKMLAQVKSGAGAILTPQGAVGQDPLILGYNVLEVEGNSFLADAKAFNEKYSAVTNELMAAGNGTGMNQTYTAGAKEIDGVKFDLMTTELTGEGPQVEQARQGFQFMYGSDKLEQYIGQVDNKVITFLGVTDDSVKALIASAKANESPLATSEVIKPIADQLPAKKVFEVYIAVDEIYSTGIRAANQFMGAGINVQLPPELPPIGVGIANGDGNIEITSYVSSDLIQALVSASMQIAAQMQGGGGGRNNGGL